MIFCDLGGQEVVIFCDFGAPELHFGRPGANFEDLWPPEAPRDPKLSENHTRGPPWDLPFGS